MRKNETQQVEFEHTCELTTVSKSRDERHCDEMF